MFEAGLRATFYLKCDHNAVGRRDCPLVEHGLVFEISPVKSEWNISEVVYSVVYIQLWKLDRWRMGQALCAASATRSRSW